MKNKYSFKATILKTDERTGIRAGTVFYPKGFYYNKKQTVIVGTGDNNTVRLAFPTEIVEIECHQIKDASKGGNTWTNH